MTAELRSGLAVVVSGPSGSGKTSLVKRLMMRYPRSRFSISATTRSPRGEEVDGIDYRFVSEERFAKLRTEDGLLEWAEVHGLYYGTPRSEVEPCLAQGHHVFLDIDVQGAVSVKNCLPGRSFLIYVLPPDIEMLETRLRGRGTDSDEVIVRRMANARGEIARLPEFDALVINDDLPRAVDEAQAMLELRRGNLAEWLSPSGRSSLRERFGIELS